MTKRYGFNSLLGVVFIIFLDTGEFLDYEIKCKDCSALNARPAVNGTRTVKNSRFGITSMRVNVQ